MIRAENGRDIYLVNEFMETNLHVVIRDNILEDKQKQFIVYQLLKSLKYMHSANILHRDLLPSNLLLNLEHNVKVSSFGLACLLDKRPDFQPLLTENDAARWYKAPEILLGSNNYKEGVDMWSLGCILGELFLGKPMFPGISTLNQLEMVMEFTGKPSKQDITAMNSPFASKTL